jgi:sarcosine oxidase, subunit alpha
MLRARSVVLATGAIEQPIVFRNDDLPGILLASAAQRLLHRWSLACGRDVVVLAATAEGAEAALDLAAAGIRVGTFACLSGSAPLAESLRSALAAAGIRIIDSAVPVQAIAGRNLAVAAIELRIDERVERIACDALLLAAGSTPALALALQAGGTQRWSTAVNRYLPDVLPRGVQTAGRASGCQDIDARRADGVRAGTAAARGEFRAPAYPHGVPDHPAPFFPHPDGKDFVDLDEDLTLGDLANAAQEGFDSTELMKRYSTVGMGPSQGKLSNLNAARYLAALRGVPFEQLSLTTARPPWQGVTLGALAGRSEAPLRRSALDAVHQAAGAQWMPAGVWRRPAWYARGDLGRAECIAAEVRAVRE